MLSEDIAKTGIPPLDAALGGLYWGDNVVWVSDDAELGALTPFYGAVGEGRDDFGLAAYVTVSSDPAEVRGRWPWLDVLDARPRSSCATPEELLEAVRALCTRARRPLLLFDSLGAMASRWGTPQTADFFARCCPMLLDLGAIAYWSIGNGARYRTLLTEVERITQCILVIEEGRLRIRKAEGRPPGVQGQLFRYTLRGNELVLQLAPAGARVGAALRAYRLRRDLSQTALAKLAGVSPSAISQVERGQRGLSLETLLELASRLNVTLDELLGGEVTPDYRIGRRRSWSDTAPAYVLPLLDDAEAGLRAYLVWMAPGASVDAPFSHKGRELTGVVDGLVQVTVGQGRPVLRRGEALLAARRPIASWRNLGESEARCFWVLGD
ncbi:MAG: XRE family transcriptional regulator [Acidimicrobiales bacterium]